MIRSWYLKPRHFIAVEGIFPCQSFLRRKLIFEIFSGGVQGFWKLFCKRKAARKMMPGSNRIENQPCEQLKDCVCVQTQGMHMRYSALWSSAYSQAESTTEPRNSWQHNETRGSRQPEYTCVQEVVICSEQACNGYIDRRAIKALPSSILMLIRKSASLD